MMTVHGPIVGRRRLRLALRQARDATGLTQEQVAGEMDWSLSKLIRIEAGSVSLSTNDLRALLSLYGITDEATIDELVDLARASRQRPWWTGYKDRLEPQVVSYIGLEAETHSLRYFNALMIPGILETEAYARALVAHGTARQPSADEVRTIVEVRLARQRQVLERVDPPDIYVLIDEAAVRRPVGGPATMRAQLIHLAECMERTNISVRIIPFSVGAYPAMYGPFVILEFPDETDTPVVFLENALSGDAVERPDAVVPYQRAFDQMRSLALDEKRSLDLIRRAAAQFHG
jgi:transcriptional regulator with XRE-family HTH domain